MPETPIQMKSKDLPIIRKQILGLQEGRCPICKNTINDPCLDHEHKKRIKGSGLVRGVLCRSCNVFIAKSENNCIRYGIPYSILPTILRNMADYLEQKQYPYIHPSEAPKPRKLKKQSYNNLVKRLSENGRKIPQYPRSGILTKRLEELFKKYSITPEFYKQSPK